MSNSNSNKISFWQATTMGVNIMVGAGLFAGPGPMAAICGNASFLGWFLAAALILPMVYNVARLPEVMPGSGGIFLYCKRSFGELGGFIGGWMYFLCYNVCLTTVLCSFRNSFLAMYPGFFLLQSKFLFLLACLTAIFLLNLLSEAMIAALQSNLTYIKVLPIVLPMLLLPFFFTTKTFSFSLQDVTALPQTLPLVIFSFFGFEFCCNLSDRVEGGASAARRSILASFLGVTLLYAVFHFALLNIMGIDGLIDYQAAGYGTFVGAKLPMFAKLLAYILPVTLFITFFNSSYGLLSLNSMIFQFLAEDKSLRFSESLLVKNGFGRPWVCSLFAAIFCMFVGMTIENIVNLAIACNLALFVLFTMVMFGLIKMESHKPFDFNRVMGFLGAAIGMVLIVFNWGLLPGATLAKAQAIIPLFVGALIGALLYSPKSEQAAAFKNLNNKKLNPRK